MPLMAHPSPQFHLGNMIQHTQTYKTPPPLPFPFLPKTFSETAAEKPRLL